MWLRICWALSLWWLPSQTMWFVLLHCNRNRNSNVWHPVGQNKLKEEQGPVLAVFGCSVAPATLDVWFTYVDRPSIPSLWEGVGNPDEYVTQSVTGQWVNFKTLLTNLNECISRLLFYKHYRCLQPVGVGFCKKYLKWQGLWIFTTCSKWLKFI